MDIYLQKRHRAQKLSSTGDYAVGRCNPEFFRFFIEVLQMKIVPLTMWEPFAGHHHSDNLDVCLKYPGAVLVAQDINPSDERVLKRDSLRFGPWFRPYGMFFHPPYFGSAPFSNEPEEISRIPTMDEYREALRKVVVLANVQWGGLACAVGRCYRHDGENLSLPRLFMEIFSGCGYVLDEVWQSEPDEALVFRSNIA